jgi:hypothetical protein
MSIIDLRIFKIFLEDAYKVLPEYKYLWSITQFTLTIFAISILPSARLPLHALRLTVRNIHCPVLPKKDVQASMYPKLPTEVTIMLVNTSFYRPIPGILTPRWEVRKMLVWYRIVIKKEGSSFRSHIQFL